MCARATPIPVPAGGAVLLATIALRAVGGIDSQRPSPEVAILDFALRAVRRGFRHVLDAGTFVMRPFPKGERPDPLSDPVSRNWLNYRHQYFPRLYDEECDSRTSPLANALTVSAAAVRGLKILIDGSCLGPYEMGTQVQTLSLIFSPCARRRSRSHRGAPRPGRSGLRPTGPVRPEGANLPVGRPHFPRRAVRRHHPPPLPAR